jgi:hypothetical protein
VSADVDFLLQLVERFPQLAEDYEIHVENNGGPLPHLFFWDVTQAIVDAYTNNGVEYADLDWRGLLDFLEEVYPTAHLDVQKVIVTSFLMNLPWPGEPGYGLVELLGPALAKMFVQVRPSG